MLTGTVKRFDAKTGQGFINNQEVGSDVFVHYVTGGDRPRSPKAQKSSTRFGRARTAPKR